MQAPKIIDVLKTAFVISEATVSGKRVVVMIAVHTPSVITSCGLLE